jgi:hypothetical protein
MTDNKLKALITEAVALDREINEKDALLKELKRQIVAEAESRPDEHADAEHGDGRAWTANGDDGCITRVNFPAPTLKSKIDGEGKAIEKIRAAAGRVFAELFVPAVSYKPCDNFRDKAEALLGKAASKLVKLCTTESAPRVSFETKETSNAD